MAYVLPCDFESEEVRSGQKDGKCAQDWKIFETHGAKKNNLPSGKVTS